MERNTADLLQTPKHTVLDKEVLFVSPVGTSVDGRPLKRQYNYNISTKEANRVR